MRLALAALLAALALASCGEDDEVATGLEGAEPVALPKGSTPKAQDIEEVNSICGLEGTGFNAEVREALNEQFAQGKSEVEAFNSAITAVVFPLVEESNERLLEIPPPTGDREDLEQFMGYVRESTESAKKYLDAFESGDNEALQEASLELDQQESANDFAKSYGINKCAGFTDIPTVQLEDELTPE